MRLASDGRAIGIPEGVKEARLALLDAARLQVELAEARMVGRKHVFRDLKTRAAHESETQEAVQPAAPGPRRVA